MPKTILPLIQFSIYFNDNYIYLEFNFKYWCKPIVQHLLPLCRCPLCLLAQKGLGIPGALTLQKRWLIAWFIFSPFLPFLFFFFFSLARYCLSQSKLHVLARNRFFKLSWISNLLVKEICFQKIILYYLLCLVPWFVTCQVVHLPKIWSSILPTDWQEFPLWTHPLFTIDFHSTSWLTIFAWAPRLQVSLLRICFIWIPYMENPFSCPVGILLFLGSELVTLMENVWLKCYLKSKISKRMTDAGWLRVRLSLWRTAGIRMLYFYLSPFSSIFPHYSNFNGKVVFKNIQKQRPKMDA